MQGPGNLPQGAAHASEIRDRPQGGPIAPRFLYRQRKATEPFRRTAEMRQPEGREVVIVEAVRTPIGRGHREKGYYKDTHPNALLGTCYSEVIKRAGIDASEVEDVIAGCVSQFGEQGLHVARNAWLQEGLPIETPGTTVDRQCGSAQQAGNFAAGLIGAGVDDARIASGAQDI